MSVVCVFSHPDDESFGPGGTIAYLSKKTDVYVLCATKGEGGNGQKEKLGETRAAELKKSAKILGVKNVTFLGFVDGEISNNKYHKIAAKIQKEIDKIKPTMLLTFEPRGVSGHIDHMAMAMITTYVFNKNPKIRELWYFCFSKDQRKAFKDYFIYFPPGYDKNEIGKTVDVTDVWSERIEAVKCHKSQSDDVNFILKFLNKYPKTEHFLILKKPIDIL